MQWAASGFFHCAIIGVAFITDSSIHTFLLAIDGCLQWWDSIFAQSFLCHMPVASLQAQGSPSNMEQFVKSISETDFGPYLGLDPPPTPLSRVMLRTFHADRLLQRHRVGPSLRIPADQRCAVRYIERI